MKRLHGGPTEPVHVVCGYSCPKSTLIFKPKISLGFNFGFLVQLLALIHSKYCKNTAMNMYFMLD